MSLRTRDECGCSLAAEVLEKNGTVRVRVSGQSMLPTLWPGDVLTIESKHLADAKPGDVVLYDRDGRFFVHRLVSKSAENASFVTRGDSMMETDPSVPAESFLGTVAYAMRGETIIVIKRRVSPLAWVLAALLSRSELLQRVALRWQRPAARRVLLPRLRETGGGIE